MTRDSMNDFACPSGDEVDDVLDRLVSPERDALLRRHVSECDACVDRYGALFEAELWSEVASAPPMSASAATSRRWLALLATAAAVVIGASIWFSSTRPRDRSSNVQPSIVAVDRALPPRGDVWSVRLEQTSQRGDTVRRRLVERDGAAPVVAITEDLTIDGVIVQRRSRLASLPPRSRVARATFPTPSEEDRVP